MKTLLRLTLAILVATTSTVQASPHSQKHLKSSLFYDDFSNYSPIKGVNISKAILNERPIIHTPSSRSDSDNVSVKLRAKYNSEKELIEKVMFYPEKGNSNDPICVYWDWGMSETEAEIPVGEYWISLITTPLDDIPTVFLFKEHVQVADGMTIDFDTAEATNRISFRPRALDGEVVTPPLVDSSNEVIELGNVGPFTLLDLDVFGPGNRNFANLSTLLEYRHKDESGNISGGISNGDILVNPVSDRFFALQRMVSVTNDGEAFVTNIPISIDKTVTASPEVDYKLVSNMITRCSEADQNFYGVNFIFGLNEILENSLSISAPYVTSPNFYCGIVDGSGISDFVYLVDLFDCEILDLEDYSDVVYGISTPPVLADCTTYPAFNYTDNLGNGIFNRIKGETETFSPAKFNEVYSRTANETTCEYGNSVPMTSFIPMFTYNNAPEEFAPSFNFAFMGMNGEMRRIDKLFAKLRVSYEGEVVCNTLKGCDKWSRDWFSGGANRGAYDINLVNDNVKLDDITGKNTTDIHFDLSNDSNILPPLLQWMQYRNSVGTVTPMLDKAEGSRLLLSSGIFDFNVDQNGQRWFTCRREPVNLKVEYAMHGSDNYKELSIRCLEDKFYIPGFGNQYEVSLNDIADDSTIGWFDLRISLSDNYGNTMIQSFEPGFHIATPSSLNSVGNDSVGVGVKGRDLITPEGSYVYDMCGRLTTGRNLESGMYIVVTPTVTVKVIVR